MSMYGEDVTVGGVACRREPDSCQILQVSEGVCEVMHCSSGSAAEEQVFLEDHG